MGNTAIIDSPSLFIQRVHQESKQFQLKGEHCEFSKLFQKKRRIGLWNFLYIYVYCGGAAEADADAADHRNPAADAYERGGEKQSLLCRLCAEIRYRYDQ